MFHRRRETDTETAETTEATETTYAFDDFHEWVLSLPWVVERPYSLGTPGVRAFGIECEPLGRRQLWLVTGLYDQPESEAAPIAVILPSDAAAEIEISGRGRKLAPMPCSHALVSVDGDTVSGREAVEALVLTAYGYAMS